MSQNYTVHYETKNIVTRYDKRGKNIGEITTYLQHTMTGVPYQTALQYKEGQREGKFQMIPEVATYGRPRHDVRFSDIDYGKRGGKGRDSSMAPAYRTKSKTRVEEQVAAAPKTKTKRDNGYAGAINKAMENVEQG